MIQGKECIVENRVGRVAQVRLEVGEYEILCLVKTSK
jgi:hypothetical protein